MAERSLNILFMLTIMFAKQAYLLKPESCYASWIIDNEALELELSNFAGCNIKISTTGNGILSLSYIEGYISDLGDAIKIYDGIDAKAPAISLVDKMPLEMRKLNVNHNKTVYTTGTSAMLYVQKELPRGRYLKIQKAVDCPFNLGTNSQCGRIFDDVSCYCATFVKRTWGDQVVYCSDNGMKLVALESAEEENAVYSAWGRETQFWTSLNDAGSEGLWIWSSTGKSLSPGYSNWEAGEPNGETCYVGFVENCVLLNFHYMQGWFDQNCFTTYEAICENSP